jgi:diguanylate cyclase (GGDEF)-like protein/PAS domain S-box-containing protein
MSIPRSSDAIAIASTFADATALALGLTTSTGVMIAFFDGELRIGWTNDRFAEWFGLSPEGLVGRSLLDVYGQEALDEAMPKLALALSGEPVRYERLLGKPGTAAKWISVSLYPHRDAAGHVLGLFACSVEVDELKRTRDALDHSLQEIAIYLDNSPLAVVEWDREGRIRRWAGQAERVFGWSHAEVVGCTAEALNLVHPDWVPSTDAAMGELRDGQAIRNRVISRNITRGGSFIYCEWFHSAFVDGDGETQGVLSLAQDITVRIEAEEQLRHAAIHDALTGCHNRRYLISRIENAIALARRNQESPALLFIDLDRFKPVNDRHGHATGDALLKAVVARLRACARESDCVARVGGDEFVVLMDAHVDAQTPNLVRDRIVQRLGQAFRIDDLDLRISASIGIARFPEDGETADQLLLSADESMYREKKRR